MNSRSNLHTDIKQWGAKICKRVSCQCGSFAWRTRLSLLPVFFAALLTGFFPHAEGAWAQSKVSVKTETVRRVRTATFEVPEGRIIVSMPERVKAGATLTGRVYLEPNGTTEAQRLKSLAELDAYLLEIERARTEKPFLMTVEDVFAIQGRGTIVGEKYYSWTVGVPKSATTISSLEPVRLILKDNSGKKLAQTPMPQIVWPQLSPEEQMIIDLEIAVLRELERPLTPSPRDFQLPRLGQEGRPIHFIGPFDGKIGNTAVIIAGRKAPVLLEVAAGRQGELFVMNPKAETVGPTNLQLREENITAESKFNNLRVLIAATKTNLLRNETSLVTTRVEGFRGLEPEAYPVSFEEVNRTPETISFEDVGGQLISHSISRDEVSEQGIYSREVTARGIQPGQFTITASVFCDFGGCTCDVKMDGKKFTVSEMKSGTFADLAGQTPLKNENTGADINVKDQPSFSIKFTIPSADVTRAGKGEKEKVTRTVSLATSVSGPSYIAWRKPKYAKDPKKKDDKDKPERYEQGSLQDSRDVACPGNITFPGKTAELMFVNAGNFDTKNFEIQIDVSFTGADCKKTFSFKVKVVDGKATVTDVTK